jgi:large subunit ribosomal protein L25
MEAVLEAVRRDQFGKNNATRLRMKGQIPAVVYGGESGKAESLAVDPKDLLKILHSQSGANTLITLKLAGAADAKVLVKEYQLHPVFQKLLHADFYRVAMDKALRVTVPIQLTGESRGVKAQGAVVDFVHREMVIECLPGNIPEHITVDITPLMLHDGVRVRDLDGGGQWKALSEPEMLIVHLVAPKTEAEPAVADAAVPVAGAAVEPEVMKKGKVEKDGEKA